MSTVAIQTSILGLMTNFAVRAITDNQPLPVPAPTEFVRVAIRPSVAEQASMAGTPTTRTTGTVIVQCFVQPGRGTRRAAEIADLVRQALQYRRVSGTSHVVQMRSAVMRDIGQPQGQTYYQVNIEVPFYADAR